MNVCKKTIVLGFVACFIFLPPLFAQRGLGGGNCTNLGCKKIAAMWSPYLPGYSPYCVEFEVVTGRYVMNTTGHQGGTPCVLQQGTQVVNTTYNLNCAICNPTVAGTAVEAVFADGAIPETLGYYGCKADGANQPCQ